MYFLFHYQSLKTRLQIMLTTVLIGLLSSCAHTPQSSAQEINQIELNKVILNDIRDSSSTIAKQLTNLNTLEVSAQGQAHLPFQNINAPELDKVLAITWYGPIEPLLKSIVKSAGYQLQIYGAPPAFPIIITLGDNDKPRNDSIINLLRNIDVQAKNQATLYINPQIKVISLRYLPS
ncbi:DotD/TraH family lipoprotein [Cysteiniphilum sp. JM-1]|uniref:DotD/TraH family lipoprotein n=1 Tax=Cysteiniphilum sp. JM-1 TaxID=2610891 RepID=UPI001CD12741|nr:DotD/TraH family lipoprotein [Cysteiniphilum sp. JM-1]